MMFEWSQLYLLCIVNKSQSESVVVISEKKTKKKKKNET
jgi:hypothetical protein